jgi:hypothetical protein
MSSGIIQNALTSPATPTPILATATKLPDPTKWTTTPDQTVAGQVKALTAEDSGIIQQARTRANQKMNERGLLNSSIAQTASDSAAYDAAIPIAQADAANASKVAGYNADTQNKFSAQDVDTQNQFSQKGADAQNDFALRGFDAQNQIALKNLDASNQAKLAEISTRDKMILQNSNVAADAYKKYSDILYQNSINKDMDAAARAQADQNAFNLYQQQVSLAATITNLPDVSSLLDYTGIAPAAAPGAAPASVQPASGGSTSSGAPAAWSPADYWSDADASNRF